MIRTFFIGLMMLTLTSCVPESTKPRSGPFDPYNQTLINGNTGFIDVIDQQALPSQPFQAQQRVNGKVALLLPLTGQHATIGQSILEAAQLALFDINDASFDIIPIDTQGNAAGAIRAVQQAANHNVNLIIGPLLANSVEAAGRTASRYGLQVIGFTTDWNKVSAQNTFTMGILPFDQGTRLAQYASQVGKRNIVIIDPQTNYSKAVIHALNQSQQLNIIRTITLSSSQNIADDMTSLPQNIDAIIMPFGNPQASQVARMLIDKGLGPQNVTWLGTGLWDDHGISSNPIFSGALYAAPSPTLRRNFENQYQAAYGRTPERLASLGYDAVALSAVMLKQSQGRIGNQSILNPNGFAGIDGIFRFQQNGLVERGLSIHRINGVNQTSIIAPAPQSFVN